jgi:hypothetical protein
MSPGPEHQRRETPRRAPAPTPATGTTPVWGRDRGCVSLFGWAAFAASTREESYGWLVRVDWRHSKRSSLNT